MNPLPLLFMGSPNVAVTVLEGLVNAGHRVLAAVTQPDKPAGRGQQLQPPPVKTFAEARGIPVLQPTQLKQNQDLIDRLRAYEAQAVVVAAYGRIIPREILEMTPWGCLNVHFSLLPKYRGASCVASAILHGEKETGVTIMRVVDKLDAGPLLLQEKTPIGPEDTTGEVEAKLAPLGLSLLLKTLEELDAGRLKAREQNETEATYAPLIQKEEGRIDWNKSAPKIKDQIRAFLPWPVAFTHVDKTRVKVYASKISEKAAKGKPGEILEISPDGLLVACGEGCLLLTEVQPESKKRMSASDFARGQSSQIKLGKVLE
ncbi:MAG: methionyl-tRNA formyltransferase [bacterium]